MIGAILSQCKLYAGGGTRTLTQLPVPDFESGASTSSAIPANLNDNLVAINMLTNIK